MTVSKELVRSDGRAVALNQQGNTLVLYGKGNENHGL
jgi:hypothetical protein